MKVKVVDLIFICCHFKVTIYQKVYKVNFEFTIMIKTLARIVGISALSIIGCKNVDHQIPEQLRHVPSYKGFERQENPIVPIPEPRWGHTIEPGMNSKQKSFVPPAPAPIIPLESSPIESNEPYLPNDPQEPEIDLQSFQTDTNNEVYFPEGISGYNCNDPLVPNMQRLIIPELDENDTELSLRVENTYASNYIAGGGLGPIGKGSVYQLLVLPNLSNVFRKGDNLYGGIWGDLSVARGNIDETDYFVGYSFKPDPEKDLEAFFEYANWTYHSQLLGALDNDDNMVKAGFRNKVCGLDTKFVFMGIPADEDVSDFGYLITAGFSKSIPIHESERFNSTLIVGSELSSNENYFGTYGFSSKPNVSLNLDFGDIDVTPSCGYQKLWRDESAFSKNQFFYSVTVGVDF
jgi:hypothetical protein